MSTLGGQQQEESHPGHDRLGLDRSKPEHPVLETRVSDFNSEHPNIGHSIRSENKIKPKMLKPKKPEIGVCKTVEAKGHGKHQKIKPKPILGELSAKS